MTGQSTGQATPSLRRSDAIVAATCGLGVAFMVGAAYAAVPLYDWFCRATGFGGTTQVATAAPRTVLDRRILVRFDANVAPGLPWRFEPEQLAIEVRIGDVVTVNYVVTNLSAQATVGQASYNVWPPTAGSSRFGSMRTRGPAGSTPFSPQIGHWTASEVAGRKPSCIKAACWASSWR